MATAMPLNPLADAQETCRRYAALHEDRAARGPRRGPRVEPERSVWRLLCFAGPVPISDEQLQAAFPAFGPEQLAKARARVAADVERESHLAEELDRQPDALTLEHLVDEPSVTVTEAMAAGLNIQDPSGWAALSIGTPEEHAAFFGAGCAP